MVRPQGIRNQPPAPSGKLSPGRKHFNRKHAQGRQDCCPCAYFRSAVPFIRGILTPVTEVTGMGMTGYRGAAPSALPPGELAREARLRGFSPLRRGTPPATAWLSPLINAGGKNGAKRPRLPLWGSWHGTAVTEEAIPADAAGNSPCHCVALPPHKCGGQGLSFRCTLH